MPRCNGSVAREPLMAKALPSVAETWATRDYVRDALGECLQATAALPGVDLNTCQWLRRKFDEDTFNLVVAGQFKRGKSTLINALLGTALLPAGVVPLTSIVTVLRYGPTCTVRVIYEDGCELDIEVEALADFVTERGNPSNSKRVAHVAIYHPSAWLANGIQLIDTPGIGSVYEQNTDVTRAFLPRADAVLFLVSADQPVSRAELDFLASIREHADKVLCLLNKRDYLNSLELPESLTFCRQAIKEAIGASIAVFPISAKFALEAKRSDDSVNSETDHGFVAFERALRQLLQQERRTAWLRSMKRSLERLLSQARFSAELELDALRAPLEQIDTGLRLLRAQSIHIRRSQQEHVTLLKSEAVQLLHSIVEPHLRDFRIKQTRRLMNAVDGWAAQWRALTGSKLSSAMHERIADEIREACETWRAREERVVSDAFNTSCARFWDELQLSLDKLLHACGELFHVTFNAVSTESLWQFESGFYYKFWNEPPVLSQLSSTLVQGLPDSIGRKLIIARAKRTAAELMEVQSGRLHADFDQRLRQSGQRFHQRMVATSEALLVHLENTIENARALRTASEEDLHYRQHALSELLERIGFLEASARTIGDRPS
jgi:GTP-binding protein EngB required for normal cell division